MKEIGAFAIFLALASPVLADTLTVDSITQLTAAGIDDEAIIAKIHSSNSRFDLTTDQMIALKAKGVSGPVIAAMLGAGSNGGVSMVPESPDPLTPHPTGVYLLTVGPPAAKMTKIDATISSQAKTGGIFGYALTAGIASMSIKASIQNASAHTKSESDRPTFYFFFDESNPDTGRTNSTWLTGMVANVSSPNEFTLVRLTQKSGRREARVDSMNIGGAKTGVMDSDRIPFTYDLVRPGVFKITPDKPLVPGEYGFIFSLAGGGAGGALTARIFDFSVATTKVVS